MARLANPATTADEADRLLSQLDACAASAVPWVYRFLHDAAGELEVHAAARVLARWLSGPLGPALEKALRALVEEPTVEDLAKMAAAGLLESLGRPVADERLAGALRDPIAVRRQALLSALGAIDRPAALVRLMETVGRMPAGRRIRLLDDLVDLRPDGASAIVAGLTVDGDAEVAVAAVAAADMLSLGEGFEPLLGIAVEWHPSDDVRREARRTRRRLRPSWPRRPWPCVRALAGGTGTGPSRLLALTVLAGADERDGWDVLTAATGPSGVGDYAWTQGLSAAGLRRVRRQFSEGGAPLVEDALEHARMEWGRATERAVAAGVAPVAGWLAWPLLLGELPAAGSTSDSGDAADSYEVV